MNTGISNKRVWPIGQEMSDKALGMLLSRRTGMAGRYMVTGPGLLAEYTLAYKGTDIASFSPVTGRVTVWACYTDLLSVYNKLLKRFDIRAGSRGNELYVKQTKGFPHIMEVQGTTISIDLRKTCGSTRRFLWFMAYYKENI
jgi:hypothetical protein|nr:MAG TPA: hypothetical protein [Caudoviricetes sp.]